MGNSPKVAKLVQPNVSWAQGPVLLAAKDNGKAKAGRHRVAAFKKGVGALQAVVVLG